LLTGILIFLAMLTLPIPSIIFIIASVILSTSYIYDFTVNFLVAEKFYNEIENMEEKYEYESK